MKLILSVAPEIARSADHESAAHYTDLRRGNLTVSLPSTWVGQKKVFFILQVPQAIRASVFFRLEFVPIFGNAQLNRHA